MNLDMGSVIKKLRTERSVTQDDVSGKLFSIIHGN